MNKLIESMCRNRGYTGNWLREINICPHKLPSHITEMCETLKKYHDSGEQVVLYTDVDMDGIMAGVIGYAGMKELGFKVALYTPDTGAYGITLTEIDSLVQMFPQAKCILTGDIGINEYEGVAYAVKKGLRVLITDSNKPQNDVLPEADVCVDPMCDEGPEFFGLVGGAYIMYLVLRYYAGLYEGDQSEAVLQIEQLKVFAGIGTLSNEVPLWYENRVMAKDAISISRQIFHNGNSRVVENIHGCQTYRYAFWGLFVMLQKFAALHRIYDSNSIQESFFTFYVAPAFNSIRRTHQKVRVAYNVFFRGPSEAQKAMDEILHLNEARKRVENEKWTRMMDKNTRQPWAPYIYLTDALDSMRGLLARKVMGQTNEPALVVSVTCNGTYCGAGRAPKWFQFIQETSGLSYVHPAGHEESFSIKIDNEESCQKLYEFLKHRVGLIKPEEVAFVPDFTISTFSEDADTDINIELFEDFLYEIDFYRPFGNGFAEPVAELEFYPDEADWSYFGRDRQHIKAKFPEGLELVCYNQAFYFPKGLDMAKMPQKAKVRGKLGISIFNGQSTVQFTGTLEADGDASGI